MGNLCASSTPTDGGGGASSGGEPARQESDRFGFRSGLVQRKDGGDIWKKYEQGRQVGRGMTGGVWVVKNKVTGQEFAMKSIILNRMKQELLDDLRNEILLLKMVSHARVRQLALALGAAGSARHVSLCRSLLRGSADNAHAHVLQL